MRPGLGASEGGPDICHTPFTRGGSGRPTLVCHVSVSALHVAGKLRKAPDPARLGEGPDARLLEEAALELT